MSDWIISDLYEVATDGESQVLDQIRRDAGQTWEHVGCWTNLAPDPVCEGCGTHFTAISALRLLGSPYRAGGDLCAAAGPWMSMIDDLKRRAGITWEHVGCWTNSAENVACENCGQRREDLSEAGETLPA